MEEPEALGDSAAFLSPELVVSKAQYKLILPYSYITFLPKDLHPSLCPDQHAPIRCSLSGKQEETQYHSACEPEYTKTRAQNESSSASALHLPAPGQFLSWWVTLGTVQKAAH